MPTHPSQYRLVQHLKTERFRQGLTQQDVADRLGLTRQAISEWEKSDGDLNLSTVAQWSSALGLELSLAPARHRPVLLNADGTAATPEMATHVLVTGPQRHVVARALAETRPAVELLYVGQPDLPASPATVAAARVRQLQQADASGTESPQPGVLVVEYSEESAPFVHDMLARARSIGWAVVVTAVESDGLPFELTQNVGLVLHADEEGAVIGTQHGRTGESPAAWRLIG